MHLSCTCLFSIYTKTSIKLGSVKVKDYASKTPKWNRLVYSQTLTSLGWVLRDLCQILSEGRSKPRNPLKSETVQMNQVSMLKLNLLFSLKSWLRERMKFPKQFSRINPLSYGLPVLFAQTLQVLNYHYMYFTNIRDINQNWQVD